MQTPGTRLAGRFEASSPILCGALEATAAACALLGWVIGDEGLKRIYPTFSAMNPATAVCLMVAGMALACMRFSPFLSRTLPALVLAFAAARLAGLVVGAEHGIDQILFPNSVSGETGQGSRMAPNTAAAIGLLALL